MNPFRIGIFDSGVGGLSIVHAVRKAQPAESTLYFADQAHVPYGMRSFEEIARFSEAITRFLLAQGADMIVIACNTATAAALSHLRETFPDIPFVGLEPAIKSAVKQTRSNIIGVLATPVTLKGPLFSAAAARIPNHIQLIKQSVPGLVDQIECGKIGHPDMVIILQNALQPLLSRQADTIVLGCTHYHLVTKQIQKITGPDVVVIDPSAAITRRVQHVINQMERPSNQTQTPEHILFTSGDPESLQHMAQTLANLDGLPRQALWKDGQLHTGK